MNVHTMQILLDRETTRHHAIEKLGYGKRTRYCLREVWPSGLLVPVDGKAYRTEDAARAAAEALGLRIDRVGDLWEII